MSHLASFQSSDWWATRTDVHRSLESSTWARRIAANPNQASRWRSTTRKVRDIPPRAPPQRSAARGSLRVAEACTRSGVGVGIAAQLTEEPRLTWVSEAPCLGAQGEGCWVSAKTAGSLPSSTYIIPRRIPAG
jgi:hypothetical protein